MTPDPALLKSIEQLGYRVTVGDVAAKAGLPLKTAEQGLLVLAEEAGGHLQVADTGEIVYLFPQAFRSILLNKYWQLKIKAWLAKIWKVIFYLVRISFGIVLVISILILLIAVLAIVIISLLRLSDSDGNSGGDARGDWNFNFFPSDFFWIFYPNFGGNYYERQEIEVKKDKPSKPKMNFLEAIFSFLFGDGDPNFNREKKRWQTIGTVIQNNNGAVIAQQLAPYLDNLTALNEETEDYVLPVLIRFNGYPKVSDRGDIIYYFPELQVSAIQRKVQAVSSYLRERNWPFSEADSGQILLAAGLGAGNVVLALVVGYFLKNGSIALIGSFGGFITGIYWFLLAYAGAFLGIPLIRYWILQWRNQKVNQRNQQRQQRAAILTVENPNLKAKIQYARQFAAQKVITEADITYATDRDYLEQEMERSDKIDEEWQKRLESGE